MFHFKHHGIELTRPYFPQLKFHEKGCILQRRSLSVGAEDGKDELGCAQKKERKNTRKFRYGRFLSLLLERLRITLTTLSTNQILKGNTKHHETQA
jgi:hypothetical protein